MSIIDSFARIKILDKVFRSRNESPKIISKLCKRNSIDYVGSGTMWIKYLLRTVQTCFPARFGTHRKTTKRQKFNNLKKSNYFSTFIVIFEISGVRYLSHVIIFKKDWKWKKLKMKIFLKIGNLLFTRQWS